MTGQTTILERLEAGLRTAGAQGRETFTIPGFQVFLSMTADDYFMSFAVPHGSKPPDWPYALAELRETFYRHHRRPRLEFFHELHPLLAAALDANGFQRDMTAPVMILTPAEFVGNPTPARGAYVRLNHEHSAQLKNFLRKQSLAYGSSSDANALGWLPTLTQGLKMGTTFAAALEVDDDLVSGATIIMGGDVGELAGVWTSPERQRQGLAYALCHHLLTDYFTHGHDLCWLSAAEGAQQLYVKLGFKQVGSQLNYGMPAGKHHSKH